MIPLHIVDRLIEIYSQGLDCTRPYPDRCEDAGRALLYLSTIEPQLFSRPRIDRLSRLRAGFVSQETPEVEYNWFRAWPLDSVLFRLTGAEHYAQGIVKNIACGNSNLRYFCLECLYLIADRLSFDNAEVIRGTKTNVYHAQGYVEHNLFVIHCMIGERKKKLEFFQFLLDLFVSQYRYPAKELEYYIDQPYPNDPFGGVNKNVIKFLVEGLIDCANPAYVQQDLDFRK